MALPALAGLGAVVVVVAFLFLLAYIVAGLVAILQNLPGIGHWFGGIADSMLHSINSALGRAVNGLQQLIGVSWHALSRSLDWVWREISSHANLLAALAVPIASLLLLYDGIRSLVHRLTATGAHSDARFKSATRELGRLERQVKALEHDQAKGIGEDVLPRIKSLDKEIAKFRNTTIPAIEAADAQASSAISDLWTWIHKTIAIPGTDAFTGAVAVALTALGLGGLRCPSFGGLLSKWGCGLGNLLDGLLGLVISALALEHVCDFLGLLETAFGDVVGPIVHLLTEVPLGDCEKPPPSWVQLNVAASPLPPQQTLGTFPS